MGGKRLRRLQLWALKRLRKAWMSLRRSSGVVRVAIGTLGDSRTKGTSREGCDMAIRSVRRVRTCGRGDGAERLSKW